MKIVMGFPNASQQEYDIIIGHFNFIKKGILINDNGGGIIKFGERIERELEKQLNEKHIFDSNIIFKSANEQKCRNIKR